MEGSILVKLQIFELYTEIVEIEVSKGGLLLDLSELREVEVEEELGEAGEHAYVLIGEVISEGLAVPLVPQDAHQTEPIHAPLLHPLALLTQTHLPQHPCQLPTPQLDHAHIVHLPQLLLQPTYQLLRDVHSTLV